MEPSNNVPLAISPTELEALTNLYCALLAKSNQEGDGIWSRFNVMVGINFALFLAFVFLFQLQAPALIGGRKVLLLLVCIMGLITSVWSFHVLLRLWAWQQYWRTQLSRVEQAFPQSPGWVRSFTPEGQEGQLLTSDPGAKRSLWLGYTQPFMAIFIFGWLVLLVLTLILHV